MFGVFLLGFVGGGVGERPVKRLIVGLFSSEEEVVNWLTDHGFAVVSRGMWKREVSGRLVFGPAKTQVLGSVWAKVFQLNSPDSILFEE